jgi:hypothetical protein
MLPHRGDAISVSNTHQMETPMIGWRNSAGDDVVILWR